MIVFISNSITNFKTRSIPKDTIIIPFEKFHLKKIISTINLIKPSNIICENSNILQLIKPHFPNCEILENQPCHTYINNQIPQNIFYISISLILSILFTLLINKNILNTILVLIFFTTSFISMVFCYSDTTRWESKITKLIDL